MAGWVIVHALKNPPSSWTPRCRIILTSSLVLIINHWQVFNCFNNMYCIHPLLFLPTITKISLYHYLDCLDLSNSLCWHSWNSAPNRKIFLPPEISSQTTCYPLLKTLHWHPLHAVLAQDLSHTLYVPNLNPNHSATHIPCFPTFVL